MAAVNEYFFSLKQGYIFAIIEEKKARLAEENRSESLLNFSIGDISLPLCPTVAKAMKEAISEMEQKSIGYGSSFGYPFLREKIGKILYKDHAISSDEVFVSDGANSDLCQIMELFDPKSKVAVPDPAYPVYRDSQILAGRELLFLPCLEENGFSPLPPKGKWDIIFLCSPHNPTGTAMSRKQLEAFVTYARENKAVLILDAAYAPFVTHPDTPSSIYEIPGAKEVAIEIGTFSKAAGFTGLRCGYTIVPKELLLSRHGETTPALPLWKKRQSIKSNGVSYPIQRGAEASLSPQGLLETQAQVALYQKSASILRQALKEQGWTFYGGEDSPYIWWKCPPGVTSWEFFDILLNSCSLLPIPGSGFSDLGEGFVRLSCFTTPDVALEAAARIKRSLRSPNASLHHA